eukprot:GHVH01008743.1.p1 GENE.GHVH01008743.1~~GHVH01008743.1.p1  ORF type:complete len:637 (+),score=118.70 GHVH01008743.1:956-2866(+)
MSSRRQVEGLGLRCRGPRGIKYYGDKQQQKGEIPSLIMKDMQSAGRQEMNAVNNLSGLKDSGVRDLVSKTTFIVTGLQVTNDSEKADEKKWEDQDDECEMIIARGIDSDEFKCLGTATKRHFREIAGSINCMDILAKHFLSSIHGNWNVKKGVLLMLAGGITKVGESDGMKMRGDVNLIIVGDPGFAKSAILKAINDFVPRSVYASGKMATAAGLTASVSRDREQNGNPVIEAGALMLADGGVCCIDEFDRMDPKDMSSIHEAMEQQTISIAKAGIQATLNARASVVAACNPIHGRYDPSKSFRQNVNLSAPILSRFDLMFVMIDDHDDDMALGSHILHCNDDASELEEYYLTDIKLRQYLKVSKTVKPKLTSSAIEMLTNCYDTLRKQDAVPGAQRHTRMTVRQLESLIRLSEGAAKLHFSEEIQPNHVKIAYELFQSSLTKITKGTIDFMPDGVTTNELGENNQPAVITVDANHYRVCADAIIHYLAKIKYEKQSEGDDASDCRVSEEDLIDWLVSKHFPEGDDNELVHNYEIAGKILKQMIEFDQTLQSDTMIDDEEAEISLISLHPAVPLTGFTEYIDADLSERASRARRGGRGAYVAPEDAAVVVEDEAMDDEDFFMESRFDEYIEKANLQ